MTRSLAETIFGSKLDIFATAEQLIRAEVIETPLLFHEVNGRSIGYKAENLQPLGSFKIRGAFHSLLSLAPSILEQGIVTASAGNFAQGLAMAARSRNASILVHMPDTASPAKVDALKELGAIVVSHSFSEWWEIFTERSAGSPRKFIHPVAEPEVIVGNGTISLEILRQWDAVDTVIVPIGGGGLAVGIAAAFRASGRNIRIVGCEIETSTPLSAAMHAGHPIKVARDASWIDGIGGERVLEEMWPLLAEYVDETVVITAEDAQRALRFAARHLKLVLEGAAAVAIAAANASPKHWGNTVAILSGGNIDLDTFASLVKGQH